MKYIIECILKTNHDHSRYITNFKKVSKNQDDAKIYEKLSIVRRLVGGMNQGSYSFNNCNWRAKIKVIK